ncbi:MAG: hypothetical protein HDQ88_02875 [Clostridia bacterium]|nr:hypothetical protein [Clostridia bacterium]
MEKATIENMELGNLIFGHHDTNNLCEKYVIDRETFQGMFHKFLESIGFTIYGYTETDELCKKLNYEGLFENDVFLIRPYYWGDDEDEMAKPNFVYKPGNVEISWYKYALRDAYCSHDLTIEQFRTMLDECTKSME